MIRLNLYSSWFKVGIGAQYKMRQKDDHKRGPMAYTKFLSKPKFQICIHVEGVSGVLITQ